MSLRQNSISVHTRKVNSRLRPSCLSIARSFKFLLLSHPNPLFTTIAVHACGTTRIFYAWRLSTRGFLKAKHLEEHETRQCPRADVECGNRCGVRLPLGDLKLHYAEFCAHRFVSCGRGCGYKVRAKASYHRPDRAKR